mgnify:CR=1 FL=1
MLHLHDIHYHPPTLGKAVLKGISLTASSGTPVVISGASGSGKTSLIEIVSGVAAPKTGHIYIDGKKFNSRQRRSRCGVLFQFPERHFLGLTIGQELRLGRRRLSSKDQFKALKDVGLEALDLKKSPERLSGGQQRRLALAVQLLRKPEIMLLDEPTAGLDWSVREEVLDLIEKLSIKQILIVVTHEPELFKNFQSSSYQLIDGRLY